MGTIREPAVAGHFYPAEAAELSRTVEHYLDEARFAAGSVPKALIAPHAGYIYSGPVAASAYATLRSGHQCISRVVLLGPAHCVRLWGLAFSSAELFRTPLGDIPVEPVPEEILAMREVCVSDTAHEAEHSLEVHLPFLQRTLGTFSIVPVVVGEAGPEVVAAVLDRFWGGPETLIAVSSDLSHYLDYRSAIASDHVTCDAIEHLCFEDLTREGACGRIPIGGLLLEARRRQLEVATLDLRNSGDTAGSKVSVVGYGAWAFLEAA